MIHNNPVRIDEKGINKNKGSVYNLTIQYLLLPILIDIIMNKNNPQPDYNIASNDGTSQPDVTRSEKVSKQAYGVNRGHNVDKFNWMQA
jgi:hypothetical protein